MEADMNNVKIVVDELYSYNDLFLTKFGTDYLDKKEEMVKEQMEGAVKALKRLEESCPKTYYMLQLGKIYNVLPEYSAQCEEILSKVVKRDPAQIEAWNMLGETFWKKGSIESAKDCFEGALKRKKNKVSLRSLSMTLRQVKPHKNTDVANNVMQSVKHAKDAVEMDTNDGTSWYILGNAYLSMFFASEQNPRVLTLSLNAYSQAEKVDALSLNNPDLHFNRAQAYRYEEKYEPALDGWKRASELDSKWIEPKTKSDDLVRYLQVVTELVSKKGKLKAKRLKSIVQSIKSTELVQLLSNMGDKKEFKEVLVTDLDEGTNKQKVVVGKVVCNMAGVTLVPFTFAIVDAIGGCCAVTVYNLAQGKGVIIGDSVAIPEPYFCKHNIKHDGKQFKFSSIRVDNPIMLNVNGRFLTEEYCAFVQASMSATNS